MAAVMDEAREVPVAAVPALTPSVDTDGMGLDELLDLAQRITRSLTSRLVRADFLDTLAPAAPAEGQPLDGSLSLTAVQKQVSVLVRMAEGAATAVAGHVSRVFEDPQERHRLLGLPTGKTGFRSSADFVEKTLHTPARRTREREDRAAEHLPARTEDGGAAQRGLPTVAGAFWEAAVDPSVVDVITRTVRAARQAAATAKAPRQWVEQTVSAGEAELMGRARREPPGVVAQACRRWLVRFRDALERTVEHVPQEPVHQGRAATFIREENGLYLWHLHLTQAQHEVFRTVTSAGANPRATKGHQDPAAADNGAVPGVVGDGTVPGVGEPAQDAFSLFDQVAPGRAAQSGDADPGITDEAFCAAHAPWAERAEERRRRQADAVITALEAALRIKDSGLPDTGGYAPQVMAVIDYDTLAGRILDHPEPPPEPEIPAELLRPGESGYSPPETPPPCGADLRGSLVSTAGFTGPIDPRVIRAWACDAQILPVVLGAQGQVVDAGPARRLFPAALRKAIIARDRGCVVPGCDQPAPWCQVHHVQEWQHGGPTTVENGVLLCQHHHQAVHHGQYRIHMRHGVPLVEDTGPGTPRARQQTGRLGGAPELVRNGYWADHGDPPW